MDQEKDKKQQGALKVNSGVEQPEAVNQEAVKLLKSRKRKKLSPSEYAEGILSGNRTLLSQAITMIESSLPDHQEQAREIVERCLPHSGNSIRIGITGVPGVGKSTFIESLGSYLTASGNKLAVLAIDPSSERSRGSILGDKTRMEKLSSDPDAFIRPSPSAGSLGGVAKKTRETIILCEAAGFNTLFIETVGVGQSETAVHSMVDFFLLLMLAGAGDELQGIKRGIMEMADAIAINKADGSNIEKATMAKAEYQNALHLFPPTESGWIPEVMTCSARTEDGIDAIWNTVEKYAQLTHDNGFFHKRRKDQASYWMHETINENLRNNFYNNAFYANKLKEYEKDVFNGKMTSFEAARKLIESYFNGINTKSS
jgi:LAO/AO transport system kinase